MSLIKELLSLPEKCIYGLFDDSNKSVYIGYSSNTIRTIYSNLMNLKYSNIDLSKLEFRVIEPIDSNIRLRVRYEYWVSNYSNNGWKMLRDYKAVGYKLRIEARSDESKNKHGKTYLYVSLVSRARKELIVGVFDAIEECNDFVKSNYSNIIDVIFADNKLTHDYRKNLK